MSGIDQELLSEFIAESRRLVDECESLLEDIEDDASQAPRLAEFANKIDRVMGGAKSLAMLGSPQHPLHIVGDITALCKALGERGAKAASQEQLYMLTVAFCLDAVEITRKLLVALQDPSAEAPPELKAAILDRVNWMAGIYKKIPKGMLDNEIAPKLDQNEIDDLMKKLGED